MGIFSEPRAIAKPGQVGTPTTSKPKQAAFGFCIGLSLDGKQVKWRNYEWIDDVLHSVFEEVK